MSVSILGAGAFGTALAIALGRGGTPVTLWARNPETAKAMQESRENSARLPGANLPETVTVTAQFADTLGDTILLSVPMQTLRSLLHDHPELDRRTLVACCKGIELGTGLGPVAVIHEAAPNTTAAILTGPSFAADIARGLPTALTLACRDHDIGKSLQQSLITPNIRLYRTTDTTGAELGGALKNVMAIACGATIGAGLGESARAALMTRGYAEMNRMAAALGAQPDTLSGLSGFGDLTLTCTSEQSRNYRLGLSLGRGEEFDTSITVEGAATARATAARAAELKTDMPITAVVVALLDRRIGVSEALDTLLSRPLKEE
ncbi:glycerol-3-phosphate dehydrogenase (NAD(P)+) [Salinihabitans flavidus]|uniref:Glycerol-3-phosphate dehydrogenase [NAD(P)+] n=1 Tax=Salinihabitans flavidus TaxID=569882 RepID=A0A1H8URN2_9RHOB|nr:NAD(P)H-dependent glycerol-3-phosphate dehydrogenase [Salinihabitans flavidus]SEP05248.1 glycerol-3-phosphate dehydrogenase (NAD(P)+) [Salinihabitans flavidus]